MKKSKSNFDSVGCVGLGIVLLLILGGIASIRQGMTLPQGIDRLLDLAETPSPTGASNWENTTNNSNSTNVVVQFPPTVPAVNSLAPTPQPTPTPAPSPTPQPTATPHPTATPFWAIVVATNEALAHRVERLENVPAPQVGFVHYGTLGVSLLIVALGGIVYQVATNWQKPPATTRNQQLTMPQPVANYSQPVVNRVELVSQPPPTTGQPMVVDGLTADQSERLTRARGEIQKTTNAIDLFPIPFSGLEFTESEANRIRFMKRRGVSLNNLVYALWGVKTVDRLNAIKEVLEQ